jgi:hypothetical protein
MMEVLEEVVFEFVAWGVGLALGFMVRNRLTSQWRILLLVVAALLLGVLITYLSEEMAMDEGPVLIALDIAQVAVAALLGAYVLPQALDWIRSKVGSARR